MSDFSVRNEQFHLLSLCEMSKRKAPTIRFYGHVTNGRSTVHISPTTILASQVLPFIKEFDE